MKHSISLTLVNISFYFFYPIIRKFLSANCDLVFTTADQMSQNARFILLISFISFVHLYSGNVGITCAVWRALLKSDDILQAKWDALLTDHVNSVKVNLKNIITER